MLSGMKIQILLLCFSLFLLASPVYADDTISLNVYNGEVRDVLTSLAVLGHVDIVADDSVTGKITVQMESMDFDTALNVIAKMKGLVYQKQGNIILVGKKDIMQSNFGTLHVMKLKFVDWHSAAEAATLVLGEAGINQIMQNTKDIAKNNVHEVYDAKNRMSKRLMIDEQTNSLLFFGTDEEAANIMQMLEKIDIPAQQVSLEAKVIAINKDAAKNLGVEWEWSKLPQSPAYTTEYETVENTVVLPDGTLKKITEDIPKQNVQRQWKNGESTPGIIQFGHGPEGHPFEFYYAATLNALISDGKANVLARPNIMTIQGKEAVINIGGEVPVPTVSTTNSTTTTSIVYREAGIILRYTPRVNKDGFITAEVHTEVSSPMYIEDLKAYRFSKRSADTNIRLKDGQTMVIGGLIGSEDSKSISKIPFLGDIPILGRFFRNEKQSKSESEVMIFLTAHIVD